MADLTSPMEFEEMTRREVPVRIGGRHYVLVEAMAGDVVAYQNMVVRATRVDAARKTATLDGYADAEVFLLSLCLYEVRDTKRVRVQPDFIRGWRNEVKQALWERLQRLSGMMDEDTIESLLEQKADIEERLARLGWKPGDQDHREDANGQLDREVELKNS